MQGQKTDDELYGKDLHERERKEDAGIKWVILFFPFQGSDRGREV